MIQAYFSKSPNDASEFSLRGFHPTLPHHVFSPESGENRPVRGVSTRSGARKLSARQMHRGRDIALRNNRRPRVCARLDDRERRSIRRIPISRPVEPHYTSVRTSEAETCIGRASVKARSRAAARPRSIQVHRHGDLPPVLVLYIPCLTPSFSLSPPLPPSYLPLESSSISNALSVAPVSISPAARCLVARVTRQLA